MDIRVAKPWGCNRDANASVCCTRKAPRRTAFTARPSVQKTHESSNISFNFALEGAHISIELMHTFDCVCECAQTQNRNKYIGILIKSRRGMGQRNRASFGVPQRIMLLCVASFLESPFCDSLRNRMKKHKVSFHEPILTPPDKATPGHNF